MNRVERVPGLPERARDAHKGNFGTVLLIAGSPGMLGAAILAARAALRGGAGLVRCALPAELMAPLTVAVPGATTIDRDSRAMAELCADVSGIGCGPGLSTSDDAGALLTALLAQRGHTPLVLDADALNLLAPLGEPLPGPGPLIITPHPGEAARLLGSDSKSVQQDREAAVLELAARSGAVVVLKGAGTLVSDGASLFENRTGNPGLATGGSGDVLTGLMVSFLAQGMSTFEAACLAVQVHGAAGDRVAARLSQAGLCAEDLPEAIAVELRP